MNKRLYHGLGVFLFVLVSLGLEAQRVPASSGELLASDCVTCHNDRTRIGGLSLQSADLANVPAGAETWEKVVRKLRAGSMPPQGAPRPDKAALDGFAAYLETTIDKAAEAKPNPGHATMHRLNRAEYANAIRDVLHLDIDASALLPPNVRRALAQSPV